MKGRWITLGVAIGIALSLTVAFAFASGPRAAEAARPSSSPEGASWWEAMDRMHDSPGMQQMHAQMPEQVRQQCEAMHEQMETYVEGTDAGQAGWGPGMMGGSGGSGMMGGSGGSGGSGMMGGTGGSGMMGG